VRLRKAGNGFDVQFAGGAARTAFVTPIGETPAAASVNGLPDGGWHVTIAGPPPGVGLSRDPTQGVSLVLRQDVPFLISVQ